MAERAVIVVGGGLAGSEAAWQIARRGVPVRLYEMRPTRQTPAHRTGWLAELVCSNSLKSLEPATPHGLLKQEMSLLGSLVLDCAHRARVPAGAALAVDRERFSEEVTRAILSEPLVEVVREEVTEIPEQGPVVLAVGPLVAERLAAAIARFAGEDYLYFYDAIAPVLEADSLDLSVVFPASRYGKGDDRGYLNCPMTQEEYDSFVADLLSAETATTHEFDATPLFEGCLPIEEMARRGRDTLRFGPLRPVGLRDPRTGRRPHAVVQLRQDNLAAEHYSMVGFQTRLRWPEQRRVFRRIPGLARAEFVRYGQVHRNCYVNAPRLLEETLQARRRPDLLFAGQVSGVEGYTESAATGLLAGINAARLAKGLEPVRLAPETMLGALCRYISRADPEGYQPTNAAFGLLPDPPAEARGKRERREARARRAIAALEQWIARTGEAVAVGSPG